MDKRYFNNNRLNNISCIMRKLIITSRDIKCKERYCVLSDGVRSGVYKKYLGIFYYRVSQVFNEYERWTICISQYELKINKI